MSDTTKPDPAGEDGHGLSAAANPAIAEFRQYPDQQHPEPGEPSDAVPPAHDSPVGTAVVKEDTPPPVEGVRLGKIRKAPDQVFRGLTWAAAVLIIAIVAFIGVFLIWQASGSLARNQANFLTSTEWTVTGGKRFAFGILGLLWTTVYTSIIALVLAVPVAMGIALLLTQFLQGRLGRIIGFVIDLLAAVPSIIYGLWGIKVLGAALLPFYGWLGKNAGAFPLFKPEISSAGNVMTASLVLAIMILPIITALCRDVFDQTPRDHKEAALALGATKWEVIQTAVLPYGRSGTVAAAMLGLGRALGETVAVMIILSATSKGAVSPSLLAGGETFASKIASAAGEFDDKNKTGAYIAAGLVLFVVTFVVNAVARVIADRGKAKA